MMRVVVMSVPFTGTHFVMELLYRLYYKYKEPHRLMDFDNQLFGGFTTTNLAFSQFHTRGTDLRSPGVSNVYMDHTVPLLVPLRHPREVAISSFKRESSRGFTIDEQSKAWSNLIAILESRARLFRIFKLSRQSPPSYKPFSILDINEPPSNRLGALMKFLEEAGIPITDERKEVVKDYAERWSPKNHNEVGVEASGSGNYMRLKIEGTDFVYNMDLITPLQDAIEFYEKRVWEQWD